MDGKELLNRQLEKLRRILNDLGKGIKNEVEKITCPFNFLKIIHNGIMYLALPFNKNKQVLWKIDGEEIFIVGTRDFDREIKPTLRKIKREEIKAGDWVYCTDSITPTFENKSSYKLVLKDKAIEYCYVNIEREVILGECINWLQYYLIETE